MFGRGYNGINSCIGNFGFMHNGLGMVVMILAILLISVAIILLLTKYKRNRAEDGAMEELKLRLVKGEISEDEYINRKKLIER